MPSHKDIKVQIYVERNPLEEYKTAITSNNGDVVESWIASEEGKVRDACSCWSPELHPHSCISLSVSASMFQINRLLCM